MKHQLSSKGLSWTSVQSPTPEELAEFVRTAGLLTVDAEFVAADHHRPEITVRSDYLLLLLQVPVFERKARLTTGASLFFVIRSQELFSLHYQPLIALDRVRRSFETSPERQEEYFSESALSLALTIITQLYDSAFRKLERLAKHIEIAEDAVFQGNERKMVEEISVLTRDVMDFRKIIRPQARLFTSALHHSLLTPEVATQWQRVHGQLLKMWEILESMMESVRELSNTNSTLLQHKENELLRLLTAYSIVIIPMLILVDPLFDPRAADASVIDAATFWIVLAVLVITLIIVLWRARRKRLL